MAGTALAASVLVVTATLAVGMAAAGGAAVVAQRVAGAADAAALAAADVASGAILTSEAPCTVAARVAKAGGGALESCTVQGVEATVRVSSAYAGLVATSHARAGQPEG